jgi:acyl-CoA dehydrogenase
MGGGGFGQVKLALMHEILGASIFAPTIFGNQAPDSGNAELLAIGGMYARLHAMQFRDDDSPLAARLSALGDDAGDPEPAMLAERRTRSMIAALFTSTSSRP